VVRRVALLMLLIFQAQGCQNLNGGKTAWQQGANGAQPYEAQLSELKNRASTIDANNQDLTKQLALARQQSQVFQDQVAQYRKEVEHLGKELKETQIARTDAERRAESLQASSQQRGGAIITANNSIRQSLGIVNIPGIDVRQEDQVIAMELPGDQLFRPGTAQITPEGSAVLDRVADAIARNYPRQRIGIEGYADVGIDGLAGNAHQAAALQASAVFDHLTQRNRIPAGQLFWVTHGANHPKQAGVSLAGRSRNRRVVVTVYPDTADLKGGA